MQTASELLHPQLLAFPREAGWKGFSRVQQEAFQKICLTDQDMIIGGATSSGKTEAAFLPLLSRTAGKRNAGVSILAISPTKALINDQFRRIEGMAKRVDVSITKWHGDASQSGKISFLRNPGGIVMMTPESLEGRFIRQPALIKPLFATLDAIVIDELHAFLEGPRGHQLASLIARLEQRVGRNLRKIAMSATLGDEKFARKWLSPTNPTAVQVLKGPKDEIDLLSRIRGYDAPASKTVPTGRRRLQSLQKATLESIAGALLSAHRTGTHLVFAGSKQQVEALASSLNERARSQSLPERFRVHHGSMAKSQRERLEEELRLGRPLTVITTSTLELGIDIGSIDSVDVIGAPRTLMAFRQQIGRSGRRDEPAMVSVHVTEERSEYAFNILDRLRLSTARAVAALNLLNKRFVEPPETDGFMLTAVLQQTLCFVQENGGATLAELSRLMRSVTPFRRLSSESYEELLLELCKPKVDLLRETAEGKYLFARNGEKLMESYEIYAAFEASLCWEVWSREEHIGSLSRTMPLEIGDQFPLAGRGWTVQSIQPLKNRILVKPSFGGTAPYFNFRGVALIHESLAAEMRRVLAEGAPAPPDCDKVTATFLLEGRSAYHEAQLERQSFVEEKDVCHLFTWKGTKFNSLLAVLLRFKRFACEVSEVAVSVSSATRKDISEALSENLPSIDDLSGFLEHLDEGKFDKWIPERLLREDWAKRHYHLSDELFAYCRKTADELAVFEAA